MHGQALLESLIQDVYRAAVNSIAWCAFLGSFAGALDSSHPSFYLADTADSKGSIEISVGIDDTQRRAYRDYYVHRNVWIHGARSLLRPGNVRSSDQVCARREFLRSEWYSDFCRPLGWSRGIGATIFQDGTTTANIGAFASDSRPQFTNEDFTLIRELLPHLQRGLKMHRALAESRAHGQALEAILYGLSSPALLVAGDSSVLFMNAAAERLIRTSDGLAVVGRRLRALLPNEAASLSAAIAAAAQTSVGRARASGASLEVSRPFGRSPLEVSVSPLPAREIDWLVRQPAVAAIFITDQSGTAAAEASTLIRRYELTACEARVIVAISRGLAGKELCRALTISYNTLKTHLKHIYAKTGAKHQSDLVRLLARGVSLTTPRERSRDA